MNETKAESKIMDTLIEETEGIMEYKPYDKVDRPMHYTAGSIEKYCKFKKLLLKSTPDMV